MASLRGDTKLMRDVPIEPEIGALAKHVDSLPEERSFLDKLKGNIGLNAGNQSDIPRIQMFSEAIRTGQLDEPRIQKLMKRNPFAASVFASALDEYKKASTSQKQVSDIYSSSFAQQGEIEGRLPDDYLGAASKLNALGPAGAEYASKLLSQRDLLNKKPDSARTSGLTATELGAAFADPTAYDPLNLVKTRGVNAAKEVYRRQYDNARALERMTVVTPSGVKETTVTPRSKTGEQTTKDYDQIHKDVIGIEEDMRKVGVSEMDDVLDSLDKYTEKHPKGLPGTGNLKNVQLANYLKEGEGQAITDQIARLESAIVLKRAGLTQTASEMERIKTMMARTVGHNAEDFIRAFRNLQSTYEKERARLLGRAGPEAKKLLSERMQINPDEAPWQTRKKASKGKSSVRQQLLEELRK